MQGGPELKDYSKFIGWDANTYILADLIDAVHYQSAIVIAANSENHEVPDIPPYPRPGDKEEIKPPTETLANFGDKLINLFGPGII